MTSIRYCLIGLALFFTMQAATSFASSNVLKGTYNGSIIFQDKDTETTISLTFKDDEHFNWVLPNGWKYETHDKTYKFPSIKGKGDYTVVNDLPFVDDYVLLDFYWDGDVKAKNDSKMHLKNVDFNCGAGDVDLHNNNKRLEGILDSRLITYYSRKSNGKRYYDTIDLDVKKK